jgi:DNA-3-methyladenine glycosylase I
LAGAGRDTFGAAERNHLVDERAGLPERSKFFRRGDGELSGAQDGLHVADGGERHDGIAEPVRAAHDAGGAEGGGGRGHKLVLARRAGTRTAGIPRGQNEWEAGPDASYAVRVKARCAWCLSDPLYIRYHDEEWGVPVHDDTRLFEMLILEGAQAGLSWLTILKRRATYRMAFNGFEAKKIARYDKRKMAALMQDAGIIRNRLKIEATIANAQAFLKLQEAQSFDRFIWSFAPAKASRACGRVVSTPEAEAMSRELKRRGFRFVGPTICYAFMQAVGLVNDHARECFRREELRAGVR